MTIRSLLKLLSLPVLALAAVPIVGGGERAEAATITTEYAAGHHEILINDYGAPALGTFVLRDGSRDLLALCVEAGDAHSNAPDAYSLVGNDVVSPELDTLIWLLGDGSTLDDDTATAAGALAWYYSGALRSIGVPVWADGRRGFEPISPLAPEPWDALPAYDGGHPIGIRGGGIDLDAVERTVVELHHLVASLAGPWTLTADAPAARVRLTGANGPLAGRTVRFTVTAPGRPASTHDAITDASGWAQPVLPELTDGAEVTAHADAPGVHQEWDGAGGIQRMITSTTIAVSTHFSIAALPRYVSVLKRSSDPTIGVAGATFALLGDDGEQIATAVTDADGVARFAAVDPSQHPAPYAVKELIAPPGLLPLTSDVSVPHASADPNAPTVVEISDAPRTVQIQVRKQFDLAPEQTDVSGFTFAVHRTQGGFDDEVVTGRDGVTDPLPVPLGDYTICEVAMPDWAKTMTDGGCVTLVVDLELLDAAVPVTVDYLNLVPPTTTTTTTTTTTSTTTAAPVTTVASKPRPAPSRSLPLTGGSGTMLGFADAGYVAGVGLLVLAGLAARRPRKRVSRAG